MRGLKLLREPCFYYLQTAIVFENFSVKSLKRDQSNDFKFNPRLFSLVNTFNETYELKFHENSAGTRAP